MLDGKHEKEMEAAAHNRSDEDLEQPEYAPSAPQELLHRKLKGRHMQMIAIGGSIGAGLFVGSGSALRTGGPANLIIDFIIIGIMLLMTVNALGELASIYPVAGSFYVYSVRFIDPAWGFAMGWNYALNWLIVLPFELIAASVTISYWNDKINLGVWITIFFVFVIAVNLFGVRGYGEVEFVLSLMKITAIVGFLILGVVINTGGVPTDNRGYIGGKYWKDPGAFRNGFKGFCSVFVTASFAFGGTELVGLAAAEAANPRKTIPKATKQVLWRIALFYILSLFIVGLIVPSNEPRLLGSGGSPTKASPFVLAIKLAGIPVLPSIFNAVITLSVMSVATSCTYASTRTMQALAAGGMGPKFLAYIDKRGRPLWALIVALGFGLLAFIGEAPNGSTIFGWLLSISGLSNFFTWGSICLAHIRFRTAWSRAGRGLDELPFTAMFGVVGSWIGLVFNILCLIAQFYIALFPIGGSPNAKDFFNSYLAFPIVVVCYVGYKIFSRSWTWYVGIADIDIDAGRREVDLKEVLIAEREDRKTWPAYKRAWDFMC